MGSPKHRSWSGVHRFIRHVTLGMRRVSFALDKKWHWFEGFFHRMTLNPLISLSLWKTNGQMESLEVPHLHSMPMRTLSSVGAGKQIILACPSLFSLFLYPQKWYKSNMQQFFHWKYHMNQCHCLTFSSSFLVTFYHSLAINSARWNIPCMHELTFQFQF